MSVFGVILIRIFPHSDWIRSRITPNTDTFYAVKLVKIAVKLILNFLPKLLHMNTDYLRTVYCGFICLTSAIFNENLHCFVHFTLHKKMKFSIKVSVAIPLESADLVTYTEKILNGKLHFLCGVYLWKTNFQSVLQFSNDVSRPCTFRFKKEIWWTVVTIPSAVTSNFMYSWHDVLQPYFMVNCFTESSYNHFWYNFEICFWNLKTNLKMLFKLSYKKISQTKLVSSLLK